MIVIILFLSLLSGHSLHICRGMVGVNLQESSLAVMIGYNNNVMTTHTLSLRSLPELICATSEPGSSSTDSAHAPVFLKRHQPLIVLSRSSGAACPTSIL